jgi:flagellar M-ring protein FliF
MDQIRKLLASLSVTQRITIVVAAILVGAGTMLFSRWKTESDFRPLYTALASEDAGAVIQKLRESGTEYRLSSTGDTVLVSSAKLAETRLGMAAAGLPKTGRIGFELFDKTTFGTTEFVEQINYKRALEGELERSVMCLAEVEQARVHITFPKDSVYVDSRQPAKASVLIRLRTGARMAPQSVQAISQLVSSAVEGLSPDSVSVMDMRGGLLARGRRAVSSDGEYSGEMLDFQQQIEKSLVAKVNATLEPLLGAERFRTSASVECDFSAGQLSEETFDPNKSVMLTSQTTEDITGGGTASDSAAGVPGTASALPNPAPRVVSARAGTTRKTENVTYQSSRMLRQTSIPKGTIKRVSIAVLVDQNVTWQKEGTKTVKVLVPPPPETIKIIRDVVTSAAGLKTERDDLLTVESLPFESTLNSEPPTPSASTPARESDLNFWQNMNRNRNYLLITAGAVALLLLGVRGLFVLVFRASRRKRRVEVAEQQPTLEQATAAGAKALGASPSSVPQVYQAAQHTALPATGPGAGADNSLVVQIRDSVRQNSDLTVSVVRNWLSRPEEGVSQQ